MIGDESCCWMWVWVAGVCPVGRLYNCPSPSECWDRLTAQSGSEWVKRGVYQKMDGWIISNRCQNSSHLNQPLLCLQLGFFILIVSDEWPRNSFKSPVRLFPLKNLLWQMSLWLHVSIWSSDDKCADVLTSDRSVCLWDWKSKRDTGVYPSRHWERGGTAQWTGRTHTEG